MDRGMGIKRFFKDTVTQKRKASSTGNAVEAWANVSTALKCCIYPISPTDAVAFKGDYLRLNITHKMNCLVSEDIQIGDKIINDSDDEYIVKKVNSWTKFLEIYVSEVA